MTDLFLIKFNTDPLIFFSISLYIMAFIYSLFTKKFNSNIFLIISLAISFISTLIFTYLNIKAEIYFTFSILALCLSYSIFNTQKNNSASNIFIIISVLIFISVYFNYYGFKKSADLYFNYSDSQEYVINNVAPTQFEEYSEKLKDLTNKAYNESFNSFQFLEFFIITFWSFLYFILISIHKRKTKLNL